MRENVLNTDLSGKVAVVTGAGGVLCSTLSRVLARAGAGVALLNRSPEKILKLEAEIRQEGGIAKAYTCDVLDSARCSEVAAEVLKDLGPCDILLNGAGGNRPGASTGDEFFDPQRPDPDTKSFFDLSEEEIDQVFQLNYTGTLIPTRIFAKQMVGRTGCSILNISSMNAYRPLTRIPAYSGAKAAVTNFTQWLAVYFSRAGIRVNAIAPGFFATAQNRSLLFHEDGTPTERAGKILAATPMGRFGDSEKELSGIVLFLVNEEAASFITGVCVPVDGGFSAYSGV